MHFFYIIVFFLYFSYFCEELGDVIFKSAVENKVYYYCQI